jgi:hypothetical protein
MVDRANMPNDLSVLVDELRVMVNELVDSITDIKTVFEAHTHAADGSESAGYFTGTPVSDAAGITAGTDAEIAAAPAKMYH